MKQLHLIGLLVLLITSSISAQNQDFNFGCPCDYDADPIEILAFFESRGFVSVEIDILEDFPAIQDPNTNDPQVSALIINCLDSHADEIIYYQSQVIDLQNTLSSSCSSLGNPDMFLTDNNDFDSDIIDDIDQAFSNSNNAMWYHIFNVSCLPGFDKDLLFIKLKEESIFTCNSESLVVEGWDFGFPLTALPPFQYSFTQKSFGPWIDFGHFDLIPCITNTHDRANSFVGDNRSFSLEDSRQYDLSNPSPTTVTECDDSGLITSRMHHSVDFTLGNINIDCEDRFSSGTSGAENFGGITGSACDRDCEFESEINGFSSFGFNNLYIHTEGSDKCITGATDIDLRSNLAFNVVTEGFNTYLQVRGFLAHKNFPAHEYILEDNVGKKVFLHTFSPFSEAEVVCELFINQYDGFYPLDYKIQINPISGNFLSEIIFSSVSSNTTFSNSAVPLSQILGGGANACDVIINSSGEDLEFEYTTWDIDSWNNFFLSQEPAGDCNSIPCAGVLGKCD